MMSFWTWYRTQLEYNKLVRRAMVLWAVVLSTYATWIVYTQLALVTGPVAAVYASTLALLGTVAKFYFDSRDRDMERLE